MYRKQHILKILYKLLHSHDTTCLNKLLTNPIKRTLLSSLFYTWKTESKWITYPKNIITDTLICSRNHLFKILLFFKPYILGNKITWFELQNFFFLKGCFKIEAMVLSTDISSCIGYARKGWSLKKLWILRLIPETKSKECLLYWKRAAILS